MKTARPPLQGIKWSTLGFLAAGWLTLCGAARTAQAEVIYVDPPDISLPASTNAGFYLNVATGQYTTDGTVPDGWDIYIYKTGTGNGNLHFGAANDGSSGYEGASLNSPLNLDPGTYIGPNSSFYSGTGLTAAFHQDGTELAGFKFFNEATGQTDYGWIELTTTAASGYPATANRWAYDDAGNAVFAGVVPEPSTWAMLSLGVVGAGLVVCRGRQRAAWLHEPRRSST
ncbi:MAG: PEP-CTERM sorting domain-containing protein [Rhodospirillales bacterium]|nr:PEP-CTERM sorting domain-containing protein [Acetobacter sp.]